MDDDDNEEIIDFDAEYLFNDPSFVDALTSESDESNAPSENMQPLSSSNSRTTSESTSVSGLPICQLSAEDAKIINEFSLEKHTKVQILINYSCACGCFNLIKRKDRKRLYLLN